MIIKNTFESFIIVYTLRTVVTSWACLGVEGGIARGYGETVVSRGARLTRRHPIGAGVGPCRAWLEMEVVLTVTFA